ncbi:MAG: AMP-binding protein [Planctomycetaceae bacterium]|nr:AMP-binding protein [Planctomycetaceae bacterium]
MLLEEFLEQTAARVPNKVALVCDGRRVTYAEIDRAANQMAHGLMARGVRRGDRVVLFLDNSVEAATAVWAVLKAGAVFVMANPTTKPDKLTYLLNNSRATALIAQAKRLRGCEHCWHETPHLKAVVVVGDPADVIGCTHPLTGWDAVIAEYADRTSPPPKQCIDADLAALIYTSGSTGNPKGVMLTHHNMVTANRAITSYLRNTSDDVVLNVLPLSFDYGLYQWLMCCNYGGTLVLEKSFTYPHATLERLVREGVTGFPIVPTVAAILLQLDLTKYDLSKLRYLSNTGAAFPIEYIRKLRQLLPEVDIYSMFGLTECKRVSYLPPEEIDRKTGSVGRAMPNCETMILDDAGHRLGPNAVGELVVRGSNVMKGYWDAPEETAKRLRPGEIPHEMWLYTGDLFRSDDEGFLYWVGRKDDIIKSRGEKVSPVEVENVLLLHPLVAEAAVVGVSDPVLGQAVRAVLRLQPAAVLTPREVQAHCRQYLEDFMVPQQIELREALPKTPNGKIDKKQLLEV